MTFDSKVKVKILKPIHMAWYANILDVTSVEIEN